MDHINGTKGQSNNAPHQIRGKRSFENYLFWPFLQKPFFPKWVKPTGPEVIADEILVGNLG